jgi:hypothetical protein
MADGHVSYNHAVPKCIWMGSGVGEDMRWCSVSSIILPRHLDVELACDIPQEVLLALFYMIGIEYAAGQELEL